MSGVTFKGEEVDILGGFLKERELAPDFILVNKDLITMTLENFKDRVKLIATVPSLDTPVCSMETKELADIAKEHPHLAVIVISKDLPFAQSRFCNTEGIENITVLSDIRPNSNFAKDYGVLIGSTVLEGLFTRSILVLDKHDKVVYSVMFPEITEKPDLKPAIDALKHLY